MSRSYPKLDNWLDNHPGLGCPEHMSLGEDENFFVRYKNKRYWYLPNSITHNIEMDTVNYMWLGKKNSWVALLKAGGMKWSLKGLYGSLGDKLSESEKPLKVCDLGNSLTESTGSDIKPGLLTISIFNPDACTEPGEWLFLLRKLGR